jgi:hypothetical protein
MEKFYSSVAKMQKSCVTTPKLWASFRPQNRQEVQILAIFAVKSWEDQILGARRRCHRTTDKDHAIPVKQGFRPCFFLLFLHPLFNRHLSLTAAQCVKAAHRTLPATFSLTLRNVSAPNATDIGRPAPSIGLAGQLRSGGVSEQRSTFRGAGGTSPKPRAAALTFMTGANRYRKSGMNCGMASMP